MKKEKNWAVVRSDGWVARDLVSHRPALYSSRKIAREKLKFGYTNGQKVVFATTFYR
jgi:hypothetical protein